MIKGVITGDVVNSTNIAAGWRQTIMDVLNTCVKNFDSITPIKIEMFRGDSFQVVVDRPEQTLAVAIALRAKLRASTPEASEIWDARVSVGIGEISFESNNIITSDGEAFHLSGRSFDSMGKKRLNVVTPWPELNNAIELNTRFADEFVSTWTVRQARIVYHSMLFPKSQKEMADELGMTRQNFNYLWLTSKGQLIMEYIDYFKTLIAKYQ